MIVSDPGGAPQTTTQPRPRPDMAALSQASPDPSRDSKVIAVFMATLAMSRHYIQDLSTISSISAFILLKVSTGTMGSFVLHVHDSAQRSYMHKFPSKWLDCNVASLLALCAYVLYNQGQIGVSFFTYHSTLCYWIGYWLEWWTGIVGLVFSVFGCTADSSNRLYIPAGDHAVQVGMEPEPSMIGSDGDAGIGLNEPPPAYSTTSTDTRLDCIPRFLLYIAHQCYLFADIIDPSRRGASNNR